MLDKLQNLDDKYEELGRMLADPEVLANPEELRKTAKARADLEDVVMAWREYRKADEELADAKVMLADDLDAWRGAYRAACVNLGREVRILRPDREEQATALDVDRDFGLMVRLADGREEILRSGEVSVRGLSGYAEG